MKEINNMFKGFYKKLLVFRQKGLLQYRKYLADQLDYASKAEIHKHYKKYIEDQLTLNSLQLSSIQTKLNASFA